ncbi:MAG: ABC transporter substrate-binding protein [Armatimonadota bacterium]|nr:ABC transporter substrate-binding protein [Armatimonadota bacterium]MDR7426775.1 ABC transporter substrate-binding protein [Armatimonadota bacterium]MDR7469865.1 ABC transporter substrate-binding protein [Armatimonadota bacterium]MDR7474325.1 ABC transporter substrate-binding protein [Armatimonadota bacterium]MDR7539935.1 ABC transporter substrate-binding protein [Armatimonadota bacterium]
MGKGWVALLMGVTVTLAAGMFLSPSSVAQVPTLGRNVKVGIVDTYSGPPAVFSNDALNGFKLALGEINRDGVLGARIEFVTRDERFSPEIGLSMARELILQERVDLLVGTINSATALAISALAREQKIPFIVWISKSEAITGAQGHRYVFSTTENTAMAGKALAEYFARKPFLRFWIGAEDYEYGHAITNSFWRFMKRAKPEATLAGQTWWRTGEPDLVPYLTSIMAGRPEAAFFGTGGAGMANVLRTMLTVGFAERVPSAIHTAIDFTALRPLGLNVPEGVTGTTDYLWYYPETPANQAFVRAFQAAYGTPPGFPAFHGYNTAYFIAEAIRKARSLDREKIIDALEGLRIRSPVGEVEMRACDHQVIYPIIAGVTKKNLQLNAIVAANPVILRGADVMPTCEDVARARRR